MQIESIAALKVHIAKLEEERKELIYVITRLSKGFGAVSGLLGGDGFDIGKLMIKLPRIIKEFKANPDLMNLTNDEKIKEILKRYENTDYHI